jgi:hypothetical protein
MNVVMLLVLVLLAAQSRIVFSSDAVLVGTDDIQDDRCSCLETPHSLPVQAGAP